MRKIQQNNETTNMNLTKQQIIDLKPCQDGALFAKSCGFDAAKIWNTCERGDWLIWLLRKTAQLDKPTSVRLAIEFAERWIKTSTEANRMAAAAAAADSADSAAATAAAAADAAANATANAAANAAAAHVAAAAAADDAYAAYAAYDAADCAAAYAAAYLAERKWQADKIREIIPCPFA